MNGPPDLAKDKLHLCLAQTLLPGLLQSCAVVRAFHLTKRSRARPQTTPYVQPTGAPRITTLHPQILLCKLRARPMSRCDVLRPQYVGDSSLHPRTKQLLQLACCRVQQECNAKSASTQNAKACYSDQLGRHALLDGGDDVESSAECCSSCRCRRASGEGERLSGYDTLPCSCTLVWLLCAETVYVERKGRHLMAC
jgi:hypothetical protein